MEIFYLLLHILNTSIMPKPESHWTCIKSFKHIHIGIWSHKENYLISSYFLENRYPIVCECILTTNTRICWFLIVEIVTLRIVYFSLLISLQYIPFSCSYKTQNRKPYLLCISSHTLFLLTTYISFSYSKYNKKQLQKINK